MESWAVGIVMEEIGKAIGKGIAQGVYANDPKEVSQRVIEALKESEGRWIDDSNISAIEDGVKEGLIAEGWDLD